MSGEILNVFLLESCLGRFFFAVASGKIGQRLGGGQNVSREFGGENVLQSVLSKTTFRGLRNWGWSGRCLFLLREMTESRQKRGGGETYRRWGVQKRFWGGVFRRIYGMFSTPLSFPPPLGRSLIKSKIRTMLLKFPLQ